jgi:hypothetical protein
MGINMEVKNSYKNGVLRYLTNAWDFDIVTCVYSENGKMTYRMVDDSEKIMIQKFNDNEEEIYNRIATKDEVEFINKQYINPNFYDFEETFFLRKGWLMYEDIKVKGQIVKSIDYCDINKIFKEYDPSNLREVYKCIKSPFNEKDTEKQSNRNGEDDL